MPDPPLTAAHRSLYKRVTWQSVREETIRYLLLACALLSVFTTLGIITVLVSETIVGPTAFGEEGKQDGAAAQVSRPFFQEVSLKEFFTDPKWTPSSYEKHYGILSLAAGTFLITMIAGLVGLPIGLLSAIFLSEYASPRARSVIKPVLEILAGVPTIVYGYFALMFITPYLIRPVFEDLLGMEVDVFNALSGGIVVGIMIVPMVCSLSEDALRAVPRSLREAGYALGSTKFDVSLRVILPAAFSGIVASFLLAISRAIGETMAVTIAAGHKPQLTLNPLEQVQTMTSFIVDMQKTDAPLGSLEYRSLYAVGLSLFVCTLLMNIFSYVVMRRFREVYH